MSLASGKSEIFQFVLQFLPDWIQIPALCLIIGLVVLSWVLKLRRKWLLRRALRQAGAGQGAVVQQQGDGTRGADFLGAYAPRQPQSEGPRGADFLGSYAPQNRSERS
ncbi:MULTISPECIES: hypothetical protein [unclassified Streptomyces]|jgi:hypothetical protein|uniref:hypothetical protein n=1 Tax=unclassified Streptomyces TaxID=2593676 RepID=UPI000DD82F04|nr:MULTISPECIES: hypothetical protein [unclassified Streptomyces]QZZ26724.1 hypothetical protein A7X85_11070 [Streptomyces sp. ST1015]